MTEKRAVLIACAALFVLGVLLYAPSLRFGFVDYDDVRIVLDHSQLYDERSLLASLREIFVGYLPREEPLLVRDLSWAINSRFFGFENAFGYHLGNVLLDAANASLLFLFLLRATKRFHYALVVATLFVLLPVHVEAVAWVMGRKDVLCAFFSLATLLLEAEAYRRPAHRRVLSALGLVMLALAMFSKISAVTLVLVLAAYRLLAPAVAGEPQRVRPKKLVELGLGLVPHLIVSVAIYAWYSRVLHQWGILGDGYSAIGALGEWLRLIPLSIGLYLKSIFSLSDYSLIYLWPDSAIPLSLGERALSLAIASSILALFAWAVRRRHDLLFFGVAFFALMLPYLHFVDVIRWRADRYLYLASFCVLAIVVRVVADLAELASASIRRVVFGAGIAWAACAALVTVTTESRFMDTFSLWSYEVGLRSPSITAYVRLASALVDRGRSEVRPTERGQLATEADRVARAGLAYYGRIPFSVGSPHKAEYANLHVQLGQAALLRGEPLAAQLAHYQDSYRIMPTEPNILFLAQSLFVLAVERNDLELARRSLHLYAELDAKRSIDPARRALAMRVHDQYRASFPALGPDIDAIERAH